MSRYPAPDWPRWKAWLSIIGTAVVIPLLFFLICVSLIFWLL